MDVINLHIRDKFKKKDLDIVESRANFYFDSQEVKIMFVVNSNFENEFSFVEVLNDITRLIKKE